MGQNSTKVGAVVKNDGNLPPFLCCSLQRLQPSSQGDSRHAREREKRDGTVLDGRGQGGAGECVRSRTDVVRSSKRHDDAISKLKC